MGERKKICLGLMVILGALFALIPVMLVTAGERTESHSLPGAEVKVTIVFSDLFYYGTKEGEVNVQFEVLELDWVKLEVFSIRVALYEGTSYEGISMGFVSEIWDATEEYTFLYRGSQSWKFEPGFGVAIPIGTACLEVRINFGIFETYTSYRPWEFYTEPKDVVVQIDLPEQITTTETTSEIPPETISLTETVTVTPEEITITETILEQETITKEAEPAFIPGFTTILALLALPAIVWLRNKRKGA